MSIDAIMKSESKMAEKGTQRGALKEDDFSSCVPCILIKAQFTAIKMAKVI